MADPLETLTQLEAAVTDLEAVLLPLLTEPWIETLEALEKPLERAKMNTMMAFGICDLIWVFLRIKASATHVPIDFAEHPVMKELITIQGYYRKIKETEFPPIRAQALDLPAAKRFITQAIPQFQRTNAIASSSRTKDSNQANADAAADAKVVDIGRHTRFRGIAKAGDKGVKRMNADGVDDSGMVVHDDPEEILQDEDEDQAEDAIEVETDGTDASGSRGPTPDATSSKPEASRVMTKKSKSLLSKPPVEHAATMGVTPPAGTTGKPGKRRADFDVFAEGVEKYAAPPGSKKKKTQKTTSGGMLLEGTSPAPTNLDEAQSPAGRKEKKKKAKQD